MLRQRVVERKYPTELLVTTQRMIDTFLPVAKGGTACIPGPFGAGKTVLQGLIARHSAVDVVVMVLCGERAGEVLETILDTRQLLQDGDNINQMMQVTGEEGITLGDFVRYQKSLFLDMVYLQQDGFDSVDAAVPIERQQESFALLQRLIGRDYHFKNKEQAREFFTRLTGLVKNLNYAPSGSDDDRRLIGEIEQLEGTVS